MARKNIFGGGFFTGGTGTKWFITKGFASSSVVAFADPHITEAVGAFTPGSQAQAGWAVGSKAQTAFTPGSQASGAI